MRTIKNFSKKIFKLKKEFNYYYRPHPGENKKIPYLINKFFKKNKIKINEVKSEDLYKDLLNKDLIVTCFSSIIIDFAKINAVSNKPLGMILSLMYDKELKFYYKKINRLNFLPFEKNGLVEVISNPSEISKKIYSSFSRSKHQQLWLKSKLLLNNSRGKIIKIK